jgi:rubrerythrin
MAYLAEKKNGAEYLAAAAAEKGDRAALYRKIAGEEMCHAEILRRMIEKTIR